MTKESKTVLVVAAHPDDDVLGCGGTMRRHTEEGDTVFVLFMTDGVGAREENEGILTRRNAAQKALEILGAKAFAFGTFPDNAMDSVPLIDIVKVIENAMHTLHPQVIYTHHHGDLNIDHILTHKAVLTACRPLPNSSVKAIYGFEVVSSTEWSGPQSSTVFLPSHFVDIDSTWKAKREALMAYTTEMRSFPHARSLEAIESMAILRGTQVGLCKAEAFTTIRSIIR